VDGIVSVHTVPIVIYSEGVQNLTNPLTGILKIIYLSGNVLRKGGKKRGSNKDSSFCAKTTCYIMTEMSNKHLGGTNYGMEF